MSVAVMGKGPHELLSPQAKFSASHGDPWVVSLDRVFGFPSKLNSELQVGQSSCHVMPWLLLSPQLYMYFSSGGNALPHHISLFSFMLQISCHPLPDMVTGDLSPQEWPPSASCCPPTTWSQVCICCFLDQIVDSLDRIFEGVNYK